MNVELKGALPLGESKRCGFKRRPLHKASEPGISLRIPFVYLHKDLILLVVVRGSGIYDLFS